MMVYGRHEEHALAGSLETRNLNHHRKRLGDEQAAHDKGDDLGVGKHGDGGQSTTQGEGARVTHEDLRGIGVEPQKADAAASACRAEYGEVGVVAHKHTAAITIMEIMTVPPARPSRPSVRLTALDMPASSKNTNTRYSHGISIVIPEMVSVVVRIPKSMENRRESVSPGPHRSSSPR